MFGGDPTRFTVTLYRKILPSPGCVKGRQTGEGYSRYGIDKVCSGLSSFPRPGSHHSEPRPQRSSGAGQAALCLLAWAYCWPGQSPINLLAREPCGWRRGHPTSSGPATAHGFSQASASQAVWAARRVRPASGKKPSGIARAHQYEELEEEDDRRGVLGRRRGVTPKGAGRVSPPASWASPGRGRWPPSLLRRGRGRRPDLGP